MIRISDKKIDEIRSILPELPDQKYRRYIEEMGLPEYDAGILSANKETAVLFEKTAEICGDPKEASNWIMVDLMKLLNDTGTLPEDMKIREASLGEIIVMVKEGKISRASGKELLKAAFTEDAVPKEYADSHDLWLVSDPEVLKVAVEKVISANEKAVGEYLSGKTKNFQFLLGQTMRETRGKADPALLSDILQKKFSEL